MTTKRPNHRPRKYQKGVNMINIKVALTPAEHTRIIETTDPRQRAAVLLKLCDDIDAVVKPKQDAARAG